MFFLNGVKLKDGIFYIYETPSELKATNKIFPIGCVAFVEDKRLFIKKDKYWWIDVTKQFHLKTFDYVKVKSFDELSDEKNEE